MPLVANSMDAPLPLNFANQVNPIFTKLGCSSGGCHGKIAGQNGFRLSLLGFDPLFDYDNLLKEAPRAPRVPGRAGQEPRSDEGDRRSAARRRQEDGPRRRGVQDRPPVDRLRRAVRQQERPGR